ncbi:hypothetical protein LARI1_G003251 [Lachnellula arida]|uniref:Uncharacterized protein n=1 Tax=Lachnellula arida TaxID=1316785 RepID=A0A8T9BGP3_9HELO|nr:hypothetical protein LARI1_G003251 [Lachnellula arida]
MPHSPTQPTSSRYPTPNPRPPKASLIGNRAQLPTAARTPGTCARVTYHHQLAHAVAAIRDRARF